MINKIYITKRYPLWLKDHDNNICAGAFLCKGRDIFQWADKIIQIKTWIQTEDWLMSGIHLIWDKLWLSLKPESEITKQIFLFIWAFWHGIK